MTPKGASARGDNVDKVVLYLCLGLLMGTIIGIAWMKRAPFGGGTVLEIRQVFEAEDFGPALTPELREQEERLRAQAAAKR